MFTLAGDTPEQAAKEAAAVMKIETALAKASTSRTDLREPRTATTSIRWPTFRRCTPDFDYSRYFKAVEVRPLRHAERGDTRTSSRRLNELIAERAGRRRGSPICAGMMLHGRLVNLPKAFFDENFAFFGKTLAGQKEPTPRWKQCTSMTDRALGEAVGQDWVKQNFPPAAKASMDKLVAALEKCSRRRHQDAAVDERRHQEGGRRKAGDDPQQDRLPGKVARLLER